tara:strand:- start:878 stop:1402 length:525 start_codon:yes stop_codon:yes gene_type:complete
MNEQQKREAEEHAAKMRELLTAYMEGHDPCVDEIVEIAALNPVETDEMYALWNQTKSHDGCISEDDAVRLTLYLWQGNVRVVKPENLGMNAFFNQIDDDLPPKNEGIDLDSLLDTPPKWGQNKRAPPLNKTRSPRAKEQFPRAICRSTCCDAEGFRYSPTRDGCASCKPNWGQY